MRVQESIDAVTSIDITQKFRYPAVKRMTRGIMPKLFWGTVVIVLTILVFIPLIEMIVISLSPMSSIESTNLPPAKLEWVNYVEAWQTVHLLSYVTHSVIIALSATVIGVAIATGLAFVLDRFHFRFRSILSKVILVSQIIPSITLLLPIYVLYAWVGSLLRIPIIGTYQGIISVYVGVSIPLATWLLIGGMNGIPRELDEAAAIDGATHFSVLMRVIVPILLPSIAVSAIFTFLSAWNDLLFSSVMTNDATRTLAIGLQEYAGQPGGGGAVLWNQLMAGAIVGSLPAVFFFLLAQRFIVNGLSAGAVRQ